MTHTLAALTALAALLGADATPRPATTATATASTGTSPRSCEHYGKPVETGDVPQPLDELSGLAASRRHPGIYFAHNDSGNDPEVFALRVNGKIVSRLPLRGVKLRDVEDIAVGPCAAGSPESCIYLGDTGDNRARREEARIVRIVEPAKLEGRPLEASILRFRYPGGPRNVEALLVEPETGRLFVFSKNMGSLGKVYRLDGLDSPEGGMAVEVADIASPRPLVGMTTGGDVHPAGDRVILRTYSDAWELRAPGVKRLEEVFAARPIQVPAPRQRQPEAIAYALDGASYLLGTEGEGEPFYEVRCADDASQSHRPDGSP